jgi:GR25 family glycosyltransferase involved in LPS biosynthesis
MKILYRVINCKKDKIRLEKFMDKAAKSNIPNVKKVSCINGKKLTDADFSKMIKDKKLKHNAELTPTEIAICLSHAKCWKELLNSSSDYMVVFEDDCRPYVTFMKKFNQIMEAGLDFDILWLYNGNWMKTKSSYKKVTTIDNITIFRETKDYNPSCSAYVITKKWAKVLYDKMFPIHTPVDNFMGEVRVKTAKHYTVENHRKKNDPPECFTKSPLMYVPCPGEGNTTQGYDDKTINKRRLSPKKRKRKSPKKSRRKSRRKSPKKSRRKSPKKRGKTSAAAEDFTHGRDEEIPLPGIENQCFEYNGKYIYIDPKSVDSAIKNDQFRITEIDKNEDKKLENGIYTWIYGNVPIQRNNIVNVPRQPNKLYVMKCITINETGNKHLHILKEIIDKYTTFNLIGAGELKVEGADVERKNYTINGLSGTFMANIDLERQAEILEEVSKFFNDTLIDFSMDTFINVENLPFTEDALNKLLNRGIKLHLYNTHGDCKEVIRHKIKHAKWKARQGMGVSDPDPAPHFPTGAIITKTADLEPYKRSA